jgi:hypothetical protein
MDQHDDCEGFEAHEAPMLTAREWSWMIASAALAAMLVTAILFGTCEVLQGDCRIMWNAEPRTLAKAGR